MRRRGILNTIKSMLDIPLEEKAFDADLIVLINASFLTLHQLGVGPNTIFAIYSDSEKWSDFLEVGDEFEAIKSYIYIKVKLMFDPPGNAFLVDSLTRSAEEFEWRLNVQTERR